MFQFRNSFVICTLSRIKKQDLTDGLENVIELKM